MKILAKNKRATFDYEILETFEAAPSLLGCEVKSVKAGRVSLDNSFANFKGGDLYLLNAHIPAWQPKNAPLDYEASRSRRLLLHKKELKYLLGKIREARLTLIPLAFVLKNNKIKVELGLGKSRRKIDKREVIRERETQREINRRMKGD